MIRVDISGVRNFLPSNKLTDLSRAQEAYKKLAEKTGEGREFTGWLDLPDKFGKEQYLAVKSAADRIRSNSQALIVIGIGGSYVGARAAIELIKTQNHNALDKDSPEIYFAGNDLSGRRLKQIISLIGDRDFSVNVISKSGTTTEPAVAFRFFRSLLEKKYGKSGAKSRIFATTDKEKVF